MKSKLRMAGVLMIALIMSIVFAGCSTSTNDDAGGAGGTNDDPLPTVYLMTVYADFSNGLADNKDLITEEFFDLETEVTVEDVAAALSAWSGLDFTINSARIEEDGAWVDWAESSTLVAGLDDREQKEDFFFYDVVSLNWFMMDSLARSIRGNFPVESVYFSQGGGQPLTFEDGQGIDLMELPVNVSYEGSPFFVAHSDVKGD